MKMDHMTRQVYWNKMLKSSVLSVVRLSNLEGIQKNLSCNGNPSFTR